jgi:hypothetical protein
VQDVGQQGQGADSGLDPDEWFPAGIDPVTARQEAAAVIAVFTSCLVRVEVASQTAACTAGRHRLTQPTSWSPSAPGVEACQPK